MRMKIFGAALIAIGLAGCSSSSSTSGSTGTTVATNGTTGKTTATTGTTTSSTTTSSGTTSGTTSAGTNTTSGTTSAGTNTTSGTTSAGNGSSNGSSGTTGATCSPSCNPGQTCVAGSPSFCACTPGSRSSLDTCAPNQNGLTVCDGLSLDCRAPRDFERPNTAGVYPDAGGPNKPCDETNGYSRLNFCNNFNASGACLYPDGGDATDPRCVQFCAYSTNCSSTATFCRTNVFTNPADGGFFQIQLDDGGYTSLGFCDLNLCGPRASPDAGVLNSDFFAACDSKVTGDGTCLPVLTGDVGICDFATPDAGPGALCDPDFLAAPASVSCGAENICLSIQNPTPGRTGQCLPVCNVHARPDGGTAYNDSCPTVAGAALTCQAISRTTLPGDLLPGICQ